MWSWPSSWYCRKQLPTSFFLKWLVWCIGDQLTDPYIFPQRLTGDIYANVLQDELPNLLKNVPLQTRRQMYYHHDGAQPHFGQVVRQYLNQSSQTDGLVVALKNWPPRSPDLNSLGWVHTCNVTAYPNTVRWQCRRDSWPRNILKVGCAVTLRACLLRCRYLAVTSKGW